jgi:hypothetical protein
VTKAASRSPVWAVRAAAAAEIVVRAANVAVVEAAAVIEVRAVKAEGRDGIKARGAKVRAINLVAKLIAIGKVDVIAKPELWIATTCKLRMEMAAAVLAAINNALAATALNNKVADVAAAVVVAMDDVPMDPALPMDRAVNGDPSVLRFVRSKPKPQRRPKRRLRTKLGLALKSAASLRNSSAASRALYAPTIRRAPNPSPSMKTF